MTIINAFIRRECNYELHKWLIDERFQKSGDTGELTFVQEVTNNEQVKHKVAAMTAIIAEKMSQDLTTIFSKVYKRDIVSIVKEEGVNVTLREYIARYVLFMTRHMVSDIVFMINSDEYTGKKLEDIINLYILGLEGTIYSENNIFLIDTQKPILEEK
jgi:hypothetical protein